MKDVIYTEDICQQIQQPEVGLRLHFLLRKLKAFKRLHQVKVSWCLERSYFLFFLIRGHFVFCSVKPKFAIASLKIVNKRVVFGHKYVAQFLLERQEFPNIMQSMHILLPLTLKEKNQQESVFLFLLSACDSYLTLLPHWLHSPEQLRASQCTKRAHYSKWSKECENVVCSVNATLFSVHWKSLNEFKDKTYVSSLVRVAQC